MASVDVVMPQLGYSITEGKILRWHKREGERIERDETLFEITTDKIDSEIPSPASGTVSKILAAEGAVVQVGVAVATIESAAGAEVRSEPAQRSAATASAVPVPAAARPAAPSGREYSPAVLALAKEQGLTTGDLDRITGTGHEGRVTKQDVLAFVQGAGAARPAGNGATAGEEEVVPLDHVKKAMAEHMARSVHTSAHTFSVSEVDMSRVAAFREGAKAEFERRHGVKLTYTHLIAHAVLKALPEFPVVNSSLEGERLIMKKYVNLGIAVSTDRGLIVPVVHGAHRLAFPEFVKAVADLSERARAKKLVPDDVAGGTFTLTNNGTFGNLMALPIINQPQVAILACGAIEPRPVAVEGRVEIRPIMYLSLAYDHRVVDGANGGGFVQRIADRLEAFEAPSF